MNHPLINNLLRRSRILAKRTIPELRSKKIQNKPEALLALAEAPYHGVTKSLDQFKGKEGLKNLGLGVATGGGLYGGSQLIDDDNKGLSNFLGTAGLIAPGVFRSGRAGLLGMRNFLDAARNLNRRGVSITSADEAKRRALIINSSVNSIRANPKQFFDKLKDAEYRKNILSVMRPDKTVKIDFLSNRQGSLDSMLPHLESMSKQFGRSILDAGTIINPNIAARVQKGSLQNALARMGYERFLGNTKHVQNIGPELHTALKDRFATLANKKVNLNKPYKSLTKEERKSLLPSHDSFFPFSVNVKGEELNLLDDAVAAKSSVPVFRSYQDDLRRFGLHDAASRYAYDNRYNPAINRSVSSVDLWDNLPQNTRDWLTTQDIKSADEYKELLSQVKSFYNHAQESARNNPRQYIEDFKLPSLRNIFKPNTSNYNFDQDLKILAPNINK
jgi:hypothetical protein